ncbi:MAG: M48 family metalloprotease [Mariniblastus sp.]
MSYYPSEQSSYGRQRQPTRRRSSGFSGLKLRLLIGGAIVLFSVVSYYSKGQPNPVTGEKQRVDMTVKDEIVMGLQAVGSMGQPSLNREAQRRVDRIGFQLVRALQKKLEPDNIEVPYPFEFHLLADQKQVNAFALPGGQIFITEALYRHLNDGELAGVLGHEVGHVIERHGSEHMATGNLFKGIAGAAGVAGGDMNSGRAAAWLTNVIGMKYGRQDELESDRWGVSLLILAGYNPEHLISVMDVLEQTAGGGGTPEFMSTHPRPANRRAYIKQIIADQFPRGVPPGLQ